MTVDELQAALTASQSEVSRLRAAGDEITASFIALQRSESDLAAEVSRLSGERDALARENVANQVALSTELATARRSLEVATGLLVEALAFLDGGIDVGDEALGRDVGRLVTKIRALTPAAPESKPGAAPTLKAPLHFDACSSWKGGLCTCRREPETFAELGAKVFNVAPAPAPAPRAEFCDHCGGEGPLAQRFGPPINGGFCAKCATDKPTPAQQEPHADFWAKVDARDEAARVARQAPTQQEAPRCASWCGIAIRPVGEGFDAVIPMLGRYWFCTAACRDAGHPLHPASQQEATTCGTPAKGRDDE